MKKGCMALVIFALSVSSASAALTSRRPIVIHNTPALQCVEVIEGKSCKICCSTRDGFYECIYVPCRWLDKMYKKPGQKIDPRKLRKFEK